MESLIAHLTDPNSINSMITVMLAMFAKDIVVALLRIVGKKLLSDKDKKNDAAGEVALAVADSLDKNIGRK